MKYLPLTLCALALAGCTLRYANGEEPRYREHVRVVLGFYRGLEGTVATKDCKLWLTHGGYLEDVACGEMEPIK